MKDTGEKSANVDPILVDDSLKVGEIIPSERTRSLAHLELCERKYPDAKGVAFDCGVVICVNGRTAMRIGGTFGMNDGTIPTKSCLLNVICRALKPFIELERSGQLADFTEQEKYQLFGTQDNRRR